MLPSHRSKPAPRGILLLRTCSIHSQFIPLSGVQNQYPCLFYSTINQPRWRALCPDNFLCSHSLVNPLYISSHHPPMGGRWQACILSKSNEIVSHSFCTCFQPSHALKSHPSNQSNNVTAPPSNLSYRPKP